MTNRNTPQASTPALMTTPTLVLQSTIRPLARGGGIYVLKGSTGLAVGWWYADGVVTLDRDRYGAKVNLRAGFFKVTGTAREGYHLTGMVTYQSLTAPAVQIELGTDILLTVENGRLRGCVVYDEWRELEAVGRYE
jgi:hypothetical protein